MAGEAVPDERRRWLLKRLGIAGLVTVASTCGILSLGRCVEDLFAKSVLEIGDGPEPKAVPPPSEPKREVDLAEAADIRQPDVSTPPSEPPPPQTPPSEQKPIIEEPEDFRAIEEAAAEEVQPGFFYDTARKLIESLNRGKELPPDRRDTALIVLAVQGGEKNKAADGRTLYETDGNFLVFLTARNDHVWLDIVSPFTRDFVSHIDKDTPRPRHKIKHLPAYRSLGQYIETMGMVAGQTPGGFLMISMHGLGEMIDSIFPQGMPIDIPVDMTTIGNVSFLAGSQCLNGRQFIAYAAERQCFGNTCPPYLGPDGESLVGDAARAQKGVDVAFGFLRALASHPGSIRRLPQALESGAFQMNKEMANALQEVDLLETIAGFTGFFLTRKAGLASPDLPVTIRTIAPQQTGVALCPVEQKRVDKGEFLAYSQVPCNEEARGAMDIPGVYYRDFTAFFDSLIGSHH